MELRQLKHYIALAKHKNYHRAAEELSISQQALSASISKLERQLGVKLLERGRFGAELTPEGQLLERRIRTICAEVDLVSAEAKTLRRGTEGAVRVGVSSAVANRILPFAVERYARSHPRVVVSVVQNPTEVLYEKLMSGQLDFVLASGLTDPTRYSALRHDPVGDLQRGAHYLIMRPKHPLAKITEVGWAEAREYPWVLPDTQNSAFGLKVLEAFRERTLQPPKYFIRTDSIITAKALILRSGFVGLLGLETASAEVEAGILVGRPLPGIQSTLPGHLSFRRTPIPAAVRAFVNALKGVISDLPPMA